MARLETRLTREYDCEHPVAAAGMAFAGMTPDLAVAVSNAGGVGALGVGKIPPEPMTDLVGAIAAAVDERPFDVNFITIFTEQAHIDAVCDARVPVVSFHWGHPSRAWIDQLHDAGVRVWEQVGTVADAVAAAEDGVDLVVAQGAEAGGHNYAALPTFVAVPAIVDAVDVPVLAAGGVSDGRGLAAALALGADGVWVGTRLVATREAYVPDGYKQRLLAASGEQTVRTSMFGPETRDFNPMRVLRNQIVEEFADRPEAWPDTLDGQPEVGTWRFGPMEETMRRFTNFVPTGDTDADLDQVPLLAGQGVGAVTDLPPAAEVVRRMVDEAAAVLDRLAGVLAER